MNSDNISNYDIQGQISSKFEQNITLVNSGSGESTYTAPSAEKPYIPATMPSPSVVPIPQAEYESLDQTAGVKVDTSENQVQTQNPGWTSWVNDLLTF